MGTEKSRTLGHAGVGIRCGQLLGNAEALRGQADRDRLARERDGSEVAGNKDVEKHAVAMVPRPEPVANHPRLNASTLVRL